ncbi:MAG: JAB domain-containing protein [Alphaproteobacteria bacterium]|nr:JAB domain-containing protein [Alphaproteobacteria bacterium]
MSNAATKEPPHYSGHRDRLRERFLKGGAEALADYELLELILFMAIPRRDVKPLAKELLARFGGFSGVMNASPRELTAVKGLSETSVAALKAVTASAHYLMRHEIMKRPVLNSWNRLIDFCQATMAHENREHFRILFLNKKNELIADEIQQSGTVDHTPAYPREIMKRALELGATALILVHNHPSGDPTPSQADVDMTRAVIEAGKPFAIVIHDHIVVSRNGYSSFKTMGLM